LGLRFGYQIARHLVAGLTLLGGWDAAKDAENLVLRHQLEVPLRQVVRHDRHGGVLHEYAHTV